MDPVTRNPETICNKEREWPQHGECPEETQAQVEIALACALDLMALGRTDQADALLTAMLFSHPRNEALWLAAGISRLRRGSIKRAMCAFKMSAWLGDNEEARALLALCRISSNDERSC
ncbi:MAG: hypothetical protein QNJ97_06475 [Myxococcota bacterium]|nr:hypothetical protein [Myxococcota bacterium]